MTESFSYSAPGHERRYDDGQVVLTDAGLNISLWQGECSYFVTFMHGATGRLDIVFAHSECGEGAGCQSYSTMKQLPNDKEREFVLFVVDIIAAAIARNTDAAPTIKEAILNKLFEGMYQ